MENDYKKTLKGAETIISINPLLKPSILTLYSVKKPETEAQYILQFQ